MTVLTAPWRLCSSCRARIEFEAKYYACSVSTCNRGRTGLYFCSLPCWEAHLPMMRHRDAWAEEQRAPSRDEWQTDPLGETLVSAASPAPAPESPRDPLGETLAGVPVPQRLDARRVVSAPGAPSGDSEPSDEVLVVVSKIKQYVRARSGMNTSDGVVGPLSDHLRRLCDEAIRNATRDGRRTVMDRDFVPLLPARGTIGR